MLDEQKLDTKLMQGFGAEIFAFNRKIDGGTLVGIAVAHSSIWSLSTSNVSTRGKTTITKPLDSRKYYFIEC